MHSTLRFHPSSYSENYDDDGNLESVQHTKFLEDDDDNEDDNDPSDSNNFDGLEEEQTTTLLTQFNMRMKTRKLRTLLISNKWEKNYLNV